MLIPLTEPSSCRYIYINPANNQVHLVMPVVSGTSIGLDNTCKAVLSVQEFFGRSSHSEQITALNELNSYKAALIFDLSLIREETPLKQAKQERLKQINDYIAQLESLKTNTVLNSLNGDYPAYPEPLKTLMQNNDSNLYSIQLRPQVQDINLRTVKPVFSINRANDAQGNPDSRFYKALWDSFQQLNIRPQDTRSRLIKAVISSPEAKHFKGIQQVLNQHVMALLGVEINFNQFADTPTQYSASNKALAAIYTHETAQGRKIELFEINNVLGSKQPEELYQQYLAYINADPNPEVTQDFVNAQMGFGDKVDTEEYIETLLGLCAPNIFDAVVESPFYAIHEAEKDAAIEKLSILTQFFMAEVNVYCASCGLSSVNFGVILDSSEELSQEIAARIVSVHPLGRSIEDTLLEFINEHHAEFQLIKPLTPEEGRTIKMRFTEDYTQVKDSPHFDEFMLLDKSRPGLFVAHQGSIGVDFSEFAHLLLITSPYFETIRKDYQQINQTGVLVLPHTNEHIEAKIDINFEALNEAQLMELLETELLGKLPLKSRLQLLKTIPESLQLCLQQRDFLYFVARGQQQQADNILRNNPERAQQLLTTPGTFTDYSGRKFSCTAYEYAYWAKDTHMCRMLEKFMDDNTKAQMLARVESIEKHGLAYQQHGHSYQTQHFDMTPLITALKEYSDGFRQWNMEDNYSAMKAAWMKVGLAQRDVPAHVAQEYCNPDRSFYPCPGFNEETLPRVLNLLNGNSWFPLTESPPSLGSKFALTRMNRERGAYSTDFSPIPFADLEAVRHLDKVRTADLIPLRENLSQPAIQERLML
ncbi:TPA: hypothetical protein ACTUT5_000231 [Legionella anisa]|nr:hypothetical protein [Legionella anisa]MBN5934163.1 hypothetical protein [Legionella anisa]MCW8426243.1 hypothetical protein [Legionella anisa]MCW8447905.1 hypothetical protein [Legionella anisa]UAK78538.1 hypothetical protein K8O89_12795 [Legionella anisa]